MLDQLKTSLEKLYLKNVNFSSGEAITSIPQTDKLKSGTHFINRTIYRFRSSYSIPPSVQNSSIYKNEKSNCGQFCSKY